MTLWPATAASTAAASSTSPLTTRAPGGAVAGSRTNAVTSWPAATACSTMGRPVAPEAPNTTSFAMRVRCHPMRIGVISDTHGLMRPEALAALAGCELIVHGGDVGGPEVLAALAKIAPVRAVRGNNDTGAWARALPATERIEVAGRVLYVIHDVKELDVDPAGAG